jgi:Ca-activated chloride channel family protein
MIRKPDYYAILGVLRDASKEEIKRAFHKAAQRLHPDKNKLPGETEIFLNVQQAYEMLSDPKRRTEYDASLTSEEKSPSPVLLNLLYSRMNLVRLDEPQIIYTLLELMPRESPGEATGPSLNLCLVLDRSTSMQGIKMDMVKNAAVEILRSLRPQDVFSVITFSDRADVLIPAAFQTERTKLEARIQLIQTSGGTEIHQGLTAGIGEVQSALDTARVNHVILLTDGHTYGDETACLTLAEEVAKQGINISGLGIGEDWNDTLLDSLANLTGGSSAYISKPQDIHRLLIEKFKSLSRIFAEEVILEFETQAGIELTYNFRLQPEIGSLPLKSPLHLGPILLDSRLTVLLEFIIQPSLTQAESAQLLNGLVKTSIHTLPTPVPPIRIHLECPVADAPSPEPPPLPILQALSRLTLYRMQEKARSEVEAGEYDQASRRLQYLATHLLAQGERGLAHTALLEAENIQRSKVFSEEGRKQIKYGTRALLVLGTKERTA